MSAKKNMLKKLQKVMKEPREGYFVLFFAMLITMLMLPIMSQVLVETIETRDGIASNRDASYYKSLGNSALQAKLDQLSKKGYGYFEKGEIDLESGYKVVYEYDSSSRTQVNLDDVEGSYSEALPGITDLNNTFVTGGPVYVFPEIGTGDAGSDTCVPGEIKKRFYENGSEVNVFDDPCNWNVLAKGETIEVPLYYYAENGETGKANLEDIQYVSLDDLMLRVRLRCIDGSDLCDKEERYYLWDNGLIKQNGFVQPVFEGNVTRNEYGAPYDFTKKILELAVKVNEQFYLPDTGHVIPKREGELLYSGRGQYSQEISIQRLRWGYLDRVAYKLSYFKNAISILNVGEFLFYNLESNEEIDNINQKSSLIFSFAKNRILACKKTESTCPVEIENGSWPLVKLESLYEVYELEYQFVSRWPLANNKYAIKGRVYKDDNPQYYLDPKLKKGQAPGSAGTVFST